MKRKKVPLLYCALFLTVIIPALTPFQNTVAQATQTPAHHPQ